MKYLLVVIAIFISSNTFAQLISKEIEYEKELPIKFYTKNILLTENTMLIKDNNVVDSFYWDNIQWIRTFKQMNNKGRYAVNYIEAIVSDSAKFDWVSLQNDSIEADVYLIKKQSNKFYLTRYKFGGSNEEVSSNIWENYGYLTIEIYRDSLIYDDIKHERIKFKKYNISGFKFLQIYDYKRYNNEEFNYVFKETSGSAMSDSLVKKVNYVHLKNTLILDLINEKKSYKINVKSKKVTIKQLIENNINWQYIFEQKSNRNWKEYPLLFMFNNDIINNSSTNVFDLGCLLNVWVSKNW